MIVSAASANPDQGSTSSSWIGVVLILGAVICEACFTIFRKLGANDVPPLLNSAWVTAFGLILCLPMGTYEALHFNFAEVPLNGYWVLGYSGVFVTAVAYYLWFSGLSKVRTGVAGIFSGVMPISVIALSTLLLGESFTVHHLLGLIVVLLSIGCIALPPLRVRRSARAIPDQ